jgi:hypothetical protein
MRSPEQSARQSGYGYAHRLVGTTTLAVTVVLSLVLAACTSRPPASPQSNETPAAATATAPVEEVDASPANSASTPDDAIADLQKIDPGSPEALNDHLEYAGHLVDATDADCQSRSSSAQSELDVASADPVLSVVLPLGLARRADLQYRIHVARASCNAAASQREIELQQALAAAQQAVDLYRDALDYESMTVAQFNVAVTQRLLGDDSASLASLEAAIVADREFGLHQDAADNARLLARWRGEAATASIPDFPARTVTLESWDPSAAQVSVQINEATVIGGTVTRGRAQRTFEQHVRQSWGVWHVSYEPGAIGYEVAQWPQEASDVRELAMSFERALRIPDFQVGPKGNFERVNQLHSFSAQQLAAARALVHDHTSPEQGNSRPSLQQAQMMQLAFHPATIQNTAEESYNFQIGMWTGATLEQGVWYKLAAPLPLPGAPQQLVPNDIEFAYTRDVPCTGAATQRGCVEIVVHARPQDAAIESLVESLYYPFVKGEKDRMHYWSTTYIRIVTDPENLHVRVYDVRRYWHASDRQATVETEDNRSERIVTTFTYPQP